MLTRLLVRNVVLINRLDLDFRKGLTVLTGETGAGKSILLDSLGLALGSRANFGLIGLHGDRADVTACFDMPEGHPVFAQLDDAGIETDGEIILRRQLREGKSSAFINDQPVSGGMLRQIGDSLIEIQGQFEGRGLLDVSSHRILLDRFAGTTSLAEETARAWQHWQEAAAALAEARDALERARAEEDYLRDAVSQLDELDPEAGEEETLAAERTMLANVNRIAEALFEIEQAVTAETGASSLMASASRTADRMTEMAGTLLDPVIAALARTEAEIEELTHAITAARDRLEGDPGRLTMIEDRLHALRTQARKHQVSVDELPQIHEDMRTKLASLDDQSGGLAVLINSEAEAADAYRRLAETLSAERRAAAARLDAAVMAELPPLKLEQAQFVTVIEELDENRFGPTGIDQIRFEATTNPGMQTAAIDKIASGGELARFLLALKVVLADSSMPMTLIFDEVDSGVGGAVAAAVGNRLSQLGEVMQCLVITHSPQVAARGRYHYRIAKAEADEGMISRAEPLQSDQRIEEISRMLSGSTVTPEARAAALRLLEAE
ncbi:MAG: DNA repair protein RecN [Candidatus Puniceispirillales bacterium]